MWNPEPFLPYFSHHHVKGFLLKHTALKVWYWSRKYTVCRRVHASFSLKILQAGTVKGVKQTLWLFALWSCPTGIPSLRLVKDWVCFRSVCACVCVSACMHAGLHACLCICQICLSNFRKPIFFWMFRYLKALCFPDNVFSNLQQAVFHTEDTKHQATQRTL